MSFSITDVLSFFLGIAFGFVLFTMIYVYFAIRGKNIGSHILHRPAEAVEEEDLKALIIDKQDEFRRLYKKSDRSTAKITYELSYELIESISSYYFPNSKYPMLELSVDEMLELNRYVIERLDGILNTPVLKSTRGVRVTKIVRAYELKRNMDEKKLIKFAKKKNVKRAVKTTIGAINLFNPAYWFRKLVINTGVDFITKKISLTIIGIVGEETSKVYSKKLFDEDLSLDVVDETIRALESGNIDDEDDY